MSYATCDHLKEDGVYCQSPALLGHNFSYFHLNVRARRVQMARSAGAAKAAASSFPCRQHACVLLSLQQVAEALADDRIDSKRAGLLLYTLQQTATALNSTPEWKGERPQAGPAQPMRAVEIPDVAQQFDLPRASISIFPLRPLWMSPNNQSTPTAKPKEHVRLARMPSRAVTQADKYFHIPSPSGKVTFDELAYELSRAKAYCDGTRKPPADSDDVEDTADVA